MKDPLEEAGASTRPALGDSEVLAMEVIGEFLGYDTDEGIYDYFYWPELRLFAAGLFILLKPYLKSLQHVVIDREYEGHEGEIKGMLLNHSSFQLSAFSYQPSLR